jgi:hypothetical protein
MKTVTVVWNKHGEGRLVGVLDDKDKIDKIHKLVKENKESNYIMFFDVEINKIDEHELLSYMESI